jgi:putative protease
VTRIILSRELSLDEVEAIRNDCPDMELEVFVHGALCIAYSGRCLLSGYFNRRDPNQGTCTNACRWEYKTHGATTETDTGDAAPLQTLDGFNFAKEDEEAASAFSTTGNGQRHPEANKVWLIEEAGRPGELMPIMEDEHGTYIMNSKDLRAVEHVARLAAMGIDSLKIEGRTKSHYYVARTAQVYRRAIDDAVAGKPFNPELLLELEGLSNRGYTGGLLERRPSQDYQNYINGSSQGQRSQFVGEVLQVREDGWAEVEAKNRFAVGDKLEVIHPGGNRVIELGQMHNQDGQAIEVAQGSPIRVWVPLNGPSEGALIARLL